MNVGDTLIQNYGKIMHSATTFAGLSGKSSTLGFYLSELQTLSPEIYTIRLELVPLSGSEFIASGTVESSLQIFWIDSSLTQRSYDILCI